MPENKYSNELKKAWHNYKTGETDFLPQDALLTMTDKQARQYVSQHPAAQGIYTISREMGLSIPETLLKVLKAQIGEI